MSVQAPDDGINGHIPDRILGHPMAPIHSFPVSSSHVTPVTPCPPSAPIAAGDRPRPSAMPSMQSPFPPIAEYGVPVRPGGHRRSSSPSGSVEWLCLPRPDSPSVFGAILDRGAGAFRLGPAELLVPAGRRYLPGTNVLETTWQTRTGWLIVRDALVMGPWTDDNRREDYHRIARRLPGRAHAARVPSAASRARSTWC